MTAKRSVRALTWATTLLLLAFAAGCGQAAPTSEQKAEPAPAATTPEPAKPSTEASKPPAEGSTPQKDQAEVEPAVVVTMLQGKYEPSEVTIKAGQAVQWWNNDTEVHGPLLILKDGDPTKRVADNGGPFRPGERFTYVFKEPGKYLLQDRAASLDVEMTQWITVEP